MNESDDRVETVIQWAGASKEISEHLGIQNAEVIPAVLEKLVDFQIIRERSKPSADPECIKFTMPKSNLSMLFGKL